MSVFEILGSVLRKSGFLTPDFFRLWAGSKSWVGMGRNQHCGILGTYPRYVQIGRNFCRGQKFLPENGKKFQKCPIFTYLGGGRNFYGMSEISEKKQNLDTREKCGRVSPRTVVALWPYEYLCFFLKTAIFEYLGNSLCIFHYVVQNTQRIVKILKNEKNSKFSVSLMIKWHHVIVSDIFLEYRNFDFWQKFLSSGRNFYHLPVGRKLGIFWKFFPFSSRNFWSLQKFLTERTFTRKFYSVISTFFCKYQMTSWLHQR